MKNLSVLVFLVFFSSYLSAADVLRLTPEELQAFSSESVVVIDARPEAEYKKGHIEGARSLPFTQTFENNKQDGRMIALQTAQELFSGVGIRNSDFVVVYDAGKMLHAARLLWLLEVYGHTNVKLLNGGMAAWTEKGYPITTAESHFAQSNFVPSINTQRFATKITTLVAANKPASFVILDARSESHYNGLESEAPRFGHIPRAKNIEVSNNLDSSGMNLKSLNDLQKLYEDIPKNKKVITYCSIGLASSLEYLVLRELGYDVANYDASWKEWGADLSLPTFNPSK